MKKIIVMAFYAMSLTVFNACQEADFADELKGDDQSSVESKDVYLEDDYLVFKDVNVLENTLDRLKNRDNDFQYKWESQFGFISAKTYRGKICQYMESLDDEALMEKYVTKLACDGYFNWKDSSVVYPFYNYSWDGILNSKGVVKIGEDLYCFKRNAQFVALDGKSETIQLAIEGKGIDNPQLKVYNRPTLKSSGYQFGGVLKQVSAREGNKRLTIELKYGAIAFPGGLDVEKVYYELYYHQERKNLFSWVDKQTHFYYYPRYLKIGGSGWDGLYGEWSSPYYGSETLGWYPVNSSELANYNQQLWSSTIDNPTAMNQGAYIGPWVNIDYLFYSGQNGDTENGILMLMND